MNPMNPTPDFHLNFQPDQPAQIVDSELKPALKTKEAAHLCSLEWFGEILNRKLYLELGYSSINQYAREELSFGNSKIGDYIKLTKKIDQLPALKQSLSKGEVGYTKGRLIVDVADETNEKSWTEFAKNNTRNELEAEVRKAKKQAHDEAARQPSFLPEEKRKAPAAVVPVRVNIEMTPSQLARYENAWQQIRKNGNVSSEKVEALLEIMEFYLNADSQDASPRGENSENSRPPAQIHIHHCPECESSIVQTNKGELEIGTTEYERYQCDCQISTPTDKNKTSIPPATRRKVLAAARHKCQTPGCNHTKFLEIHHIIARAKGGSNELSNLMVVCSACHARIHAHGMHGRPEKHERNSSHSVVKSPLAFYCWNGRQQVGLAGNTNFIDVAADLKIHNLPNHLMRKAYENALPRRSI